VLKLIKNPEGCINTDLTSNTSHLQIEMMGMQIQWDFNGIYHKQGFSLYIMVLVPA
jgi:hypothetical protein